jgi:HEAT repeat protein
MGHRDSPTGPSDRPDKKTVERVKDLLLLFSHTASAMKLFPDYNASVVGFRDDFLKRLSQVLDLLTELDIDIEESTFSYEGEVVYRDPNVARGLPYLFFKDGMQRLIFLRGLEIEELQDFLAIVKTNALLPPDAGDIVDALWERDFEHVRYVAPDEFLESKIGGAEGTPVPTVDKETLYQGRIILTPDDRQEFEKKKSAPDRNGSGEMSDYAGLVAAINQGDLEQIESLLRAEHQPSKEDDFLDTMFELLYLEERPGPFTEILDFMTRHEANLVKAGDFAAAVLFMNHLEELGRILQNLSRERAGAVERLIGEIKAQTDIDELRTLVRDGRARDIQAFFAYLKRIGPKAFPLAADLFEDLASPDHRAILIGFLEDMAKVDPRPVALLSQDRKPDLSKTIIDILGRLPDRQAVPLLAMFINSQNGDIRLHAARTLGAFSGGLASKLLLNFLHDPQEDIRIAAARSMRLTTADEEVAAQVVKVVSEKGFFDKSPGEKSELLNLLGRSGTTAALRYLGSLLEKGGLLERHKTAEARLGAVRALGLMGTPEALEALRAGARGATRAVREACENALRDAERSRGPRERKA